MQKRSVIGCLQHFLRYKNLWKKGRKSSALKVVPCFVANYRNSTRASGSKQNGSKNHSGKRKGKAILGDRWHGNLFFSLKNKIHSRCLWTGAILITHLCEIYPIASNLPGIFFFLKLDLIKFGRERILMVGRHQVIF